MRVLLHILDMFNILIFHHLEELHVVHFANGVIGGEKIDPDEHQCHGNIDKRPIKLTFTITFSIHTAEKIRHIALFLVIIVIFWHFNFN